MLTGHREPGNGNCLQTESFVQLVARLGSPGSRSA